MNLVIVCFTEKTPKDTFHSSEWPLHMTFVPPFSYSGEINTLKDLLSNYAEITSPFYVTANERALFGPNKDISVTLIEQNKQLQNNYAKLLSKFDDLEIQYKHSSISGPNYKFHITDQNGVKCPKGKIIPITNFSLVNRQLDGQPGLKQILQTFRFAEK